MIVRNRAIPTVDEKKIPDLERSRKLKRGSERRVLILTLSAGGGHAQAAKAKREELERNFPEWLIVEHDLMKDWLGKFGRFTTGCWNKAKTGGNVIFLNLLAMGQSLFEWLFWVPLFIQAWRQLRRHKIDHIIDTQNLGTAPLLAAVRCIRRVYGKKIRFDKILTDLPTSHTTLYFVPLRKLSAKSRALVNIIAFQPLTKNRQEEAHFWQEQCKLPLGQISYRGFPLREAFKRFAVKPKTVKQLSFMTSFEDEHTILEKIFALHKAPLSQITNGFTLPLESSDKIALIMLGSHPHENVLLTYLNHFIELHRAQRRGQKELLFIFCSPKGSKELSFQKKLLTHLSKYPNYPSSLTIIPLSYQEDSVVAPLFYRSNAILTRSGGLTAMELLTLATGQIWIHQENNPTPSFLRSHPALVAGMPPWEKGNADYLQTKLGAKLISPETFSKVAAPYFSS